MRPSVPTTGRHLVIVGPTASGKSDLAVALARRRRAQGEDVEIVSADSMAVYRGMDIGTTTPSLALRSEIPHHLVDLVEPTEEYSVATFLRAARAAVSDIEARGGSAVVVGGSGLYVQALVDDLDVPGQYPKVRAELDAEPDTALLHRRLTEVDPLAASRMEPGNRRRVVRALEVTLGSGRAFSDFGPGLEQYPPSPYVQVGLRVSRDALGDRIRQRLMAQLDEGFLDEVERLGERVEGLGVSRTASQALGYRELADVLSGEVGLDDAIERIVERTRRFAVRQDRWFRRDPRITWFDAGPDDPSPAVLEHWRSQA